MNGYDRYHELVVEWAAEYMKPHVKEYEQGVDVSTKDHSFFIKLFREFSEIPDTVKALKLSGIFISLAPPRSKKVTHDDYIRYHIHAYLQEIYILKERLISYAKKLQRVYAKTQRKTIFDESVNPMFELVANFFKDLVSIRGGHVHACRFSDEGLDKLVTYTLISNFNDEYVHLTKIKYKLLQLEWKGRVKDINKAMMTLLDTYCNALFNAITEEGKIVVPGAFVK